MQEVNNGERFQVRVESSTNAKAFLNKAQKNMSYYPMNTNSRRADRVSKYPKGYKQHMHSAQQEDFLDLSHIKYYSNGTDDHIFYDILN